MENAYLYVISGFLAILGLLTLFNNTRHKANIFFFFVSILAIGWIWINYLSNTTTDIRLADLYNKLIFVDTSLLIYFLYLFSTVFPADRKQSKVVAISLVVLTVVTIIIDFSSYLVSKVEIFSEHSTITFGYGIYFYLVHFVVCTGLFIINIVRSYKKAEGTEKTKIQYLLLGIIFSLIGAGFTNLILPIFTGNFNLSNIGPAFLLFFVGFTTISMVRYRLFGIRFLLGQILRIIALTIVPVLGFYIMLYVFRILTLDIYGIKAIVIIILSSLPFSVIYLFVFKKTEQIFLGKFVYGGIDPNNIINKYSKDISVELNVSRLTQKTMNLLKDLFDINKIGIFVFDLGNFNMVHKDSMGFEIKNLEDQKNLKILTQYFDKVSKNKIIVKGELQGEDSKDNDNLVKFMELNGINIVIPLDKRLRLEGFIVMGKRDDKRDLTAEELKLLEDLIVNTSVGISRAVLYQEIQTFNQTLQEKVNEQTKELQIKVSELEEARRKENDMIDIMGHELRTPATIVKLNASFLNKFVEEITSNPDSYKKYVSRIQDAVENEIKLINTLLSSAKLEGNKIEINAEEVDILEEVDMALHGVENDAKVKGLALINRVDSNTPNVYADKARIVEVLNNLLSNAIKYTDKGGVGIVSAYDKDFVKISVTDTGRGIPAEDISKLGQKFYRVNNYIESGKNDKVDVIRPGGTGLGLYVTFNLIRKMGGEVTVTSEVGSGTTFTFTIPRFKGQAAKLKPSSFNMFDKLGLKK